MSEDMKTIGKPYLLPESLATFERNVELKNKLNELELFIYDLADSMFKLWVVTLDGSERVKAGQMLMKASDWYGWDLERDKSHQERCRLHYSGHRCIHTQNHSKPCAFEMNNLTQDEISNQTVKAKLYTWSHSSDCWEHFNEYDSEMEAERSIKRMGYARKYCKIETNKYDK